MKYLTEHKCQWKEDEYGNWETGCDGMIINIVGTPKENKMNWCAYCGGKLRQKIFKILTPK